MKPKTRKDLKALIGAIKGLANASQEIRINQIAKSSGNKKYYAWQEKRSVGNITRIHLLAYGFLRGRTRDSLEKPGKNKKLSYQDGYFVNKTETYIPGYETKLYANRIFKLLEAYGFLPYHCTIEDVQSWLVKGDVRYIFYTEKRKISEEKRRLDLKERGLARPCIK